MRGNALSALTEKCSAHSPIRSPPRLLTRHIVRTHAPRLRPMSHAASATQSRFALSASARLSRAERRSSAPHLARRARRRPRRAIAAAPRAAGVLLTLDYVEDILEARSVPRGASPAPRPEGEVRPRGALQNGQGRVRVQGCDEASKTFRRVLGPARAQLHHPTLDDRRGGVKELSEGGDSGVGRDEPTRAGSAR